MDFVVRNIPVTGLDGAFRIHLAPESIQQAGLTFNEPCQIFDSDGKTVGCGISWRAADKMGASPKVRPARMSETLREAFGIKEGSHVTLQPIKTEILHAEQVILTDVTSAELISGHDKEMADARWETRCKMALCNAEAIANGMGFEINAKKIVKKRFVIDSVLNAAVQTGVPHLYYVNDRTHITFFDGTDGALSSSTEATTNGHRYEPLSTERIGGLVEQVQTLNSSMRNVLEQARESHREDRWIRKNYSVILHGYEGTGKTFLLDHLERSSFRKVSRLDEHTLESPSSSKNRATITSIFEEAKASQPSLILMDDIHKIAPNPDDRAYGKTISKGLDGLADSRVLVVGATRNLQDMSSELLGPGRFVKRVEIAIPDLKGREQILSATLRDVPQTTAARMHEISSRTHGFTHRDLALLVDVAKVHRLEHEPDDHDIKDISRPGMSDANHSEITADSQTLQNGVQNGDTADATLHLRERDWEYALSQVRPTALREISFETPKIRWADIGGSEPVKARLDEIIGWPLKYADRMKDIGLSAQKGMLLYGPPGCSKTLTAQAVAANYDMNFIPVKGAELVSMYVGESERAVREVFRKARTAKPCIIFFDEIDSIASEREGPGTKGLNVLTTLLNEMDGFESLEGVFVLAATNKPDVLDPAIMRPGRFDQHLYLPPPNEIARREIFQIHLSAGRSEDDMDLAALVEVTEGYTGAEVVNVCDLAKREMFRRSLAGHGSTIRMADFEKALAETSPKTTREVLERYEAFAKV